MMTKISPRAIVNEISCWMTKLPYAIVRSVTVIRGEDTAGLESEDMQDHGKDAVHDDDEDDGGDHGRGGGEADGGGASPRLHAPKAADQRDQDPEHDTLADADEEAGEAHGVARLLEVLGGAESQHGEAHDGAPQDPHEVRVDRQERHHENQREHPREDEELHR